MGNDKETKKIDLFTIYIN